MPPTAEDPFAELRRQLLDLRSAAGGPSLRAIYQCAQRSLGDAKGPSAIGTFFTGARDPRWVTVETVVRGIHAFQHRRSNPMPAVDLEPWRKLFEAADDIRIRRAAEQREREADAKTRRVADLLAETGRLREVIREQEARILTLERERQDQPLVAKLQHNLNTAVLEYIELRKRLRDAEAELADTIDERDRLIAEVTELRQQLDERAGGDRIAGSERAAAFDEVLAGRLVTVLGGMRAAGGELENALYVLANHERSEELGLVAHAEERLRDVTSLVHDVVARLEQAPATAVAHEVAAVLGNTRHLLLMTDRELAAARGVIVGHSQAESQERLTVTLRALAEHLVTITEGLGGVLDE